MFEESVHGVVVQAKIALLRGSGSPFSVSTSATKVRDGSSTSLYPCATSCDEDDSCGDDEAGAWLRDTLGTDGCGIDGLVTDTDRPTTVKRSLVGLAQHRHPQKMFRVDVETTDPLSDAVEQQLLSVIRSMIDTVDIVCLEDYGKGVCTESL